MSYHFSLNDLFNHFEDDTYNPHNPYNDEYYVVRSRLTYQLENDFEEMENDFEEMEDEIEELD